MAGGLHEFGPFSFDQKRHLLLKNGEPVNVGKRCCSLLGALLASRGRTVTKERLMDAVWPSVSVEESNLSVQVASLRKCLGRNRNGESWIVTVQGMGYQFVDQDAVQEEDKLSASMLGIRSSAGKPSIAVLPFRNLSGDARQEYFAEGVVEEITTALSRLPQLFVISRNSSFAYRGRSVDVRQVGRELGVSYVLEGSVRRSGRSVRVVGQLVECCSARQLWTERFDGTLSDIFRFQDEIARKVGGAIAPTLEFAEIRRAADKPTRDLGAYEWYLRGMASFHKFTSGANDEALDAFRRAIGLDVNFALAYGMSTRCYLQRNGNGWVRNPEADLPEAEALARRAEELGLEDSEVLSSIGLVYGALIGDIDRGTALIGRALSLNPNSAWAWLSSSFIRIYMGEPEVAVAHAACAMSLSPRDPQKFAMQTAMSLGHFFAGRPEKAAGCADAALIERPHFVVSLCVAAASHAALGNATSLSKAVALVKAVRPAVTYPYLETLIPLRRTEDITRWAAGLRRAGLQKI